jgi:hypothetical protein
MIVNSKAKPAIFRKVKSPLFGQISIFGFTKIRSIEAKREAKNVVSNPKFKQGQF